MSFTWFSAKPLLTRVQWGQTFLRVIRELGIVDERGAFICTAMCAFQEAGAPVKGGGPRQIWVPGNLKDPCYAANPDAYPHDSGSNDGLSSGPFQQQMSEPGKIPAWGWGGLVGDPEGTRKRMDPYESTKLFVAALKKSGFNPTNANTANDSVQRVQQSGMPTAYAQWFGEAQKLYNETLSGAPQPEEPAVSDNRPDFNEFPLWTKNCKSRGGIKATMGLIHTQEGGGGNSAAEDLANFCVSTEGTDDPVSYHYYISQASDGGVTVVDGVDTDLYSYSVGNANAQSINLCFAGSRAAWTRDQWLRQAKAIDVAAYLLVQDAKKYGFSTLVVPPPYTAGTPGISDHNWVTKVFGWGTHTDVGNNFPWDVLAAAVQKYATDAPPTVVEPPAPPAPNYLKEIWDQLRIDWPQLGGQSLVNALAEVRDKVCGTNDKDKR